MQTSIEWLLEQLENYDNELLYYNSDAIIQAKEMHKKEIIDAYDKGEFNDGMNESAEQYYTENYTENYPKLDVSKGSGMSEKPNNHIEPQLPQQEICISCDEQKETHKICMDCIGKMINENQQEISDTEIEYNATNAWVEFNKNNSDDSNSFYNGWGLAIKWYREQLKSKNNDTSSSK